VKTLKMEWLRRPIARSAAAVLFALALLPGVAAAAGADSPRLARAKDLIADEQWRRAVVELRAAYADPNEPARDEAAFWLAHSLYRSGDAAGALQTIKQIEQRFPRSRWIYPARSLQLEIAHRLNRNDLLWKYATPPPPAPAPPALPAEPVAPVNELPPAPPATPVVRPGAAPAPPATPRPRAVPRRREWVRSFEAEDLDLQIQALGSLIRVEPARAVPILKGVALATEDEELARRAIFVLMQSRRVDARAAVRDLAATGPEPVALAAVKELGLFAPEESARLLRELYASRSAPVKSQVLRAFGSSRQVQPLLQIVRSEREPALREAAVAALGQAGARPQLARLYRQHPDLRLPVITALFTAAGEQELAAIARSERDPALRAEAQARLALFK